MGTGTGVLAFFAAQAGARRVYAVEASDVGKPYAGGRFSRTACFLRACGPRLFERLFGSCFFELVLFALWVVVCVCRGFSKISGPLRHLC